MTDLDHLQRSLEKARDRFLNPDDPILNGPRPVACPTTGGYQVQLVVRMGPLSPDTLFVHDSDKLSRLEAKIDAERAARDAGWATVGRVHDIIKKY